MKAKDISSGNLNAEAYIFIAAQQLAFNQLNPERVSRISEAGVRAAAARAPDARKETSQGVVVSWRAPGVRYHPAGNDFPLTFSLSLSLSLPPCPLDQQTGTKPEEVASWRGRG